MQNETVQLACDSDENTSPDQGARDRSDDVLLSVGFNVDDDLSALQEYILLDLHALNLSTGELHVENTGSVDFDMFIHLICLVIP